MQFSLSVLITHHKFREMKRLIWAFAIMLSAVSLSYAQTLTQRLQKKVSGEGSVIIYQHPEIEALLNGSEYPPKVVKPIADPKPAQKEQKTAPHKKSGPENVNSSLTSDNIVSVNDKTGGATSDQYGKKVFKRSVTVNGYSIRLYSGDNSRAARQKAYSVGYLFKSSYLNIPVYTHFVSPHWNCTVGNFRTYEEAQKLLSELRESGQFNGAIIVKSKIQVAQ